MEQPLNTSSQSEAAEPTHFDALFSEVVGEEEGQQIAQQSAAPKFAVSQEDFRKAFKGVFATSSAMTGIQSLKLPNTHVGEDEADAASDVLYETILDIPALHFLLNPSNKWLGRAIVMATFTMGMMQAVKTEALIKAQAHEHKARAKSEEQDPFMKEPDLAQRSKNPSQEQAAALGAA